MQMGFLNMNLYRGEPLLIVYGTQSADDSVRSEIAAMAVAVSRWSAPHRQMEFGTVPIVADTALDATQLRTKNLFLIGGPDENSISARLMSRMPIQEVDGVLHLPGDETIALNDKGYGFVCPNPEHPSRLIFMYASSNPGYYQLGHEGAASRLLSRVDTDPLIPDVWVETARDVSRAVRVGAFTHGWVPKPLSADVATRVPASEQERLDMSAEAYRQATGADFTVVPHSDGNRANLYDTDAISRWDELRILFPDPELVTFEIPGRELLELARPAERQLWRFRPAPDTTAIVLGMTYRIAASIDVFWLLRGSHGYNVPKPHYFADNAAFRDAL